MVNPSLKAKIEAAKSALESGQASASTDQRPDNSLMPNSVPRITPEIRSTKPAAAGAPINFESNAAELDARITSLEGKLAENQRDLYTLVGKIREVIHLQNDYTKKTGPINAGLKKNSADHQNIIRHMGRKAFITLAVFVGISIGTGFFLAADLADWLSEYLAPWIMQFVDFISDIVR